MIIDAHGVLILSAPKSDNVSSISMIVWLGTFTESYHRIQKSLQNGTLSLSSVFHIYQIKTDRNSPTVLSLTSRMAVRCSAPVSISRAKLEF